MPTSGSAEPPLPPPPPVPLTANNLTVIFSFSSSVPITLKNLPSELRIKLSTSYDGWNDIESTRAYVMSKLGIQE